MWFHQRKSHESIYYFHWLLFRHCDNDYNLLSSINIPLAYVQIKNSTTEVARSKGVCIWLFWIVSKNVVTICHPTNIYERVYIYYYISFIIFQMWKWLDEDTEIYLSINRTLVILCMYFDFESFITILIWLKAMLYRIHSTWVEAVLNGSYKIPLMDCLALHFNMTHTGLLNIYNMINEMFSI